MFKANPSYESELRKQPEYRTGLMQAAQPALDATRDATPRGQHRGEHAADSLQLTQSDEQVALISTDPFWHLLEFGSANNPPYAPMRRGIRIAGFRLDPTR